jgi:hypothetical protein
MSKTSGIGANFYLAGFDLSGDVAAVNSIHTGSAVKEVTTINQSAVDRMLLQRDGSLDISSWFDTVALAEHAALKTLADTDVLATLTIGTALGNPAACTIAKQATYDLERGEDGSLAVKASVLGNGFGLDWGYLLTTGKQTVASAGNGTGVDLGNSDAAPLTITAESKANPTEITTSAVHGMATGDSVTISGSNSTPSCDGNYPITWVSSTKFTVPFNVATTAGTAGTAQRTSTGAGAAAYLQVFTHGSNTITCHIESSADNGVSDAWADVTGLLFTVAAGQTAGERVATSATGIVKRYARLVTAGSFANAIICCVIARNQAAS